jgi:hypothetical protein
MLFHTQTSIPEEKHEDMLNLDVMSSAFLVSKIECGSAQVFHAVPSPRRPANNIPDFKNQQPLISTATSMKNFHLHTRLVNISMVL